jgi:23S rRNA (cytosine1962-C5)-methyltransferase
MSGLVIAPRARIFHGHEWVYASEVAKTFGDPQPGAVVTLKDFRDRPLGSAIYNPRSQIVARRFSRRSQDLDAEFFRRRIGQAAELRTRLGVDPTLCRLVWSESDGLPGLVIDRYGDHFVVQTLTLAFHQRLDLITAALIERFAPASITLRNDSPVLKAEGIEAAIAPLHGAPPGPVRVTVNGLLFETDLADGQKTGLYLDQLENHARVARHAAGKRVLDCFTNHGGFALACAKAGAATVTAVEISESACEATRRNAALNGLEIEVVQANVFDFLKQAAPDYDLIVLDPPSFTRNKKSVNDAMRGYKEIHLRALQLLDKGALLATFCCSHHVSRELFTGMIVDAAVDAKRSTRLVETHAQRADHPVLLGLPETEYLKGLTLELMPGR